jgi:spermidine synthase
VARLRSTPTVIARSGDLIVERDPRRPSGRLLRQAEMEASYVDLADPTWLEFNYLRWMRVVLEAARARRVLHVGGAGCALARALAAADPTSRQEVCEIDGDVLLVARDHLGLRRMPGLRVHQVDGRDFLTRQPDHSWDAVIIDAFVGALVPRRLITVQALGAVARVAPLAAINVVDNRTAHEVRRVAAGLRAVYSRVWALEGRDGNTVIVGARAPLNLEVIAARVAADSAPPRLVEPGVLAAQIASTPAYHDDPAPA